MVDRTPSVLLMSLVTMGMILVLAPASAQDTASDQLAPLLEGLGDFTYPVTTTGGDPKVQEFFDQGLLLSFGFNHKEAERSFREAARRDTTCAMCWWGVALVNGPSITAPMEASQVPVAWDALQKARSLSARVTDLEQGYIDALASRYIAEPVEDRSSLDEAYAGAMGDLVSRYPGDATLKSLFAEALMDQHPWDYWQKNGDARPWTGEIIRALESARRTDRDHPLANHLYIHAVEASGTPERGLDAAERLGDVIPGAGHLVHMPSHIYIRVGEFHKASLANQRAIQSDNDYLAQCNAQGVYPLATMPYNHYSLWATATLEGRSSVAIEAAFSAAEQIDSEMMRAPGLGTLQHYYVTPLYALVRFGKWEEILELPDPDEDLVYPRGIWHYARGMAMVRTGRVGEAGEELQQVQTIAADSSLAEVTIWGINSTSTLVEIAALILEGEIAAKTWDFDASVELLKKAIELEDDLRYHESPDWFFPVRQILGAVLVDAARYAEAEVVYREDLAVFPKNGWSLYGMAQALRGGGRSQEARRVEMLFEGAWQWSDIALPASRF
jgi:tetratricopeptide (TPR) repeat protein